MRRFGLVALLTAYTCLGILSAHANPVDGAVRAGAASISTDGKTLTINQSTNKAIIDWRSFNIAHDETTRFNQPSAASLTLNRVNGSAQPSLILGALKANGTVLLINPSGVVFGRGSKVDVNGLVASTADISNANFMNGRYVFDKPGLPDAAIVNAGEITAAQAGLVGLVAPVVVNSGVINARLGRVQLASGDTMTLDLYGDRLLEVAVSDQVKAQLVANSGKINAAGGSIALTAAAGGQLIDSLIVAAGEMRAPAVAEKGGDIYIFAEGSHAVKDNVTAAKDKKSGGSTVIVSGTLDAAGLGAGQKGGSITVLGDNVGLADGARLDASGDKGGGDIRIGGDFHGAGSTPTALNTFVAQDTLIAANAGSAGNGGSVAVWADDNTRFLGNILAEGGLASGNGGFVETSGRKYLDAQGYVDLRAPNGEKGTYLLDPENITIYGAFAPNYAQTIQGDTGTLASNLQLWLDASNPAQVSLNYKLVTTTNAGSAGNIITVSDAASLKVGERIQIGTNNSQLASVNGTANVYTILAINGTNVTLDASPGAVSNGTTIYGGYVSAVADASGHGNTATQVDPAHQPLWLATGQNGRGTISFNGIGDYLDPPGGAFANLFYASKDNAVDTAMQLRSYFNNPAYFANTALSLGRGIVLNAFYGPANEAGSLITGTFPYYTASGTHYFNVRNTVQGYFDAGQNSFLNGNATFGDPAPGYHKVFRAAYALNGRLIDLSSNTEVVVMPIIPYFSGYTSEVLSYSNPLTPNAQALVSQYESARYGIAISGPGVTGAQTGLTGAEAQGAMASTHAGATTDGYSVFTADYLTRLSQTSNIILDASNNITLDLQNATLGLASGKSLTLTAGNQITTASAGTVTTNNGAINLNAANGINLAHAMAFNSNGGAINFNNALMLGADAAVNSGNGSVAFASTINGAHNLSVNAGAGSLTFGGAVGGNTALGDVSLLASGSLTLPAIRAAHISATAAGASADMTVGGALSASGAGAAITLLAGRDLIDSAATADVTASNADGDILLKANDDILFTGGADILAAGGDITLDSNADGTATGGISLDGTMSVSSGGGRIVMGGGSDATVGFALGGGSNKQGILIKNTAINAGGGDIIMNGHGGINASSNSAGISLYTTNTVQTQGDGKIIMTGIGAGASDTTLAIGIYLRDGSSISAENGEISLSGTAGLGPENAGGIIISNTGANRITSTGSGAITLFGQGGGASADASNNGVTFKSPGQAVTQGSGALTITGIAGMGGTGITTSSNVILGIGDRAGAITLIADTLLTGSSTQLRTASTVTIKPYTKETAIDVAASSGSGLFLTTALINRLVTSAVILGRDDGTGAITLNAATWGAPLTVKTDTGTLTVAGAQTMSAGSFTAQTGGTGSLALNAGISTSNANISLSGPVTLGGNVALAAGSGTIAFGGAVNGAYNLTASGNALTFGGALGGLTPLGDVTLTSGTAVTLPAISAAHINASTTGNDLTIGGALLASGGGAAITLAAQHDLIDGTATAHLSAGDDEGGILLTAKNSILWSAGADIASAGGDITLASNTDESSGGAISLDAGTVISSTGGNIILGGGADPANMAALGTASNVAGIRLAGASINAGGGDITLNGHGRDASTANSVTTSAQGIMLNGAAVQTSGGGRITMTGTGGGTGAAGLDVGIYLYNGATVSGENGLIFLTGTGGNGTSGNEAGIAFSSTGVNRILSTGGGVTLFGAGGTLSATTDNRGLAFNHAGQTITTTSGAVSLTGIGGGGSSGVGGTNAAGIGDLDTSGNISVIADLIGFGTGTALKTTGTVLFQPYTYDRGINVASSSGSGVKISSALLGNTTAGNIVIGRNDGAGLVTLNAATWNAPLTVKTNTGGITIAGVQAMGANAFTAQTFGASDITIGAGGGVSTSAAGTGILLASGRNFFNNAGSGALSDTGGRWLVYSANPAGNDSGSLAATFDRYSCVLGGACPSFAGEAGNGFLYSFTPQLVVTPVATSVAYGNAAPAFTYALSGYLTGELSTDSVTGSPLYSTAYTQGNNAGGHYDIIAAANGADVLISALGYSFTYATRTNGLSVTKRDVTASFVAPLTKTYGDANPVLSLANFSFLNLVDPDDAGLFSSIAPDYGTIDAHTNAGSDYAVSATLGDTLNYHIVSAPTTTLTIDKRTLTITTTGVDRAYDGTRISALLFGDDRVTGDDLTITGDGLFDDKNAGEDKTVSVSGISLAGTDKDNYTFNTTAATQATISKAALTISAVTDSKTYDGTRASDGTASVLGLQTGDTLTSITQQFDNKNAGTGKTLSIAGYTLSDGNNGGNYDITLGTATGSVSKADLTISAVTDSKTYDGTRASSGTATAVGLQTGDTLTSLTQQFDNKNAGTGKALSIAGYTLTDGNSGGNYNVILHTATGAVGKAGLTLAPIAQNKVYDGTLAAVAGVGATGLVSGDTVTGVSVLYDGKDVGAHTLSFTGYTINDGNSGNNYTVTANTASGTITAAPLTIRAKNGTLYAGGTAPLSPLGFTVSGLYGGDAVSGVTLASAGTGPASAPGTYAITPSDATGTGLANYVIHYLDGLLTILAPTVSSLPNTVVQNMAPVMNVASSAPPPAAPTTAAPAAPTSATTDGGNAKPAPASAGGATPPHPVQTVTALSGLLEIDPAVVDEFSLDRRSLSY